MKRIADKVLLLLIAIIVVTPAATLNIKPDQVSKIENRALAELTAGQGVSVFMNSVNTYLNDRIGFRDDMMRLYNDFNYKVLSGHHEKVICGKNGWLFYKNDLPDYTGVNIDPEKTEHQVEVIREIDRRCQEMGTTFVLAVGPNKSSIYDENMPDDIYHAAKSSVDRTVEELRKAGIRVCYPKEKLLQNKTEKELYYRLDTHWNSYGARYMLDELASQLDLPPCDFPVEETAEPTGDLLDMLGVSNWTGNSVNAVVEPNSEATVNYEEGAKIIELCNESGVNFVCYRDSFHNALIFYYSYYFNGPIYWSYDIDFDALKNDPPKILILSCVERYLDDLVAVNEDLLGVP